MPTVAGLNTVSWGLEELRLNTEGIVVSLRMNNVITPRPEAGDQPGGGCCEGRGRQLIIRGHTKFKGFSFLEYLIIIKDMSAKPQR